MKTRRICGRQSAWALLAAAVCMLTGALAVPSSAAGQTAKHTDAVLKQDPLTALLQSVNVERPRSYGNLTIFAVTAPALPGRDAVTTMDEALDRGWLVINEVGAGSVNDVVAVNRSNRYIFLMASEMIGGAKQDRTIGRDVVLPPHSKTRLPVFCVEHGRWTPGAPAAAFSKVMKQSTPLAVRRTVRLKQDQSEVWANVAGEQSRLAAPSTTGALSSVYESPRVQRDLAPYVNKFDDVPMLAPNTIGVVVANGDDIVCADLFRDPGLFRRLWPKLLRSYAADAIGRPGGGGAVGVAAAERFLRGLLHARRTPIDGPGVGRETTLRGAGVTGSAVVFQHAVIHLEAFPGEEAVKEAPRPERDMNLQFRREQLRR